MIVGRFTGQVLRDVRDKLLRELAGTRLKRPMMKNREIDILREILKTVAPLGVLEWGCGYSTLYFPRFLQTDARWLSVEHNGDWANKVEGLCGYKNVEIIHIPREVEGGEWSDPDGDGTYEDLRNYVDFPMSRGKFDLIIVDGRARTACIEKSLDLLNPGGVVLLHDARREIYHEPFGLFKYQELFTRETKLSGGFWIASVDTPITDVIDVERHRNIWALYETPFARFLGL